MHGEPRPGFFIRRGAYKPQCRQEPVPRFECRTCGRGFSYQTFRADYRDRRPHDNVPLFLLLTSGVSLRQSARLVHMSSGAAQRKFRKLGRVLRRLNRNLLHELPANRTLLLDEFETFELSTIQPVTVPVVVDRDSKLVVATCAGAIRRVAKRGSRRRQWLERVEKKHGRRRDRSRLCVRLVLRRCRQLLQDRPATLLTDQKPLYAALRRPMLGAGVTHETVSSKQLRTTWNPLFVINHTEAMLRDNCGRLRRRSWLLSKQARYLRRQLDLFAAYRNWHRPRTNHEPKKLAPGVAIGLIDRNLEAAELLAWRQDWSRRSIHPASADARRSYPPGAP
jgi:transposase-like protein